MIYRDWLIEKTEAVQVGYRTGSGDPGKGRKIKGYQVSHPEHTLSPRWCGTLREAKQYVDDRT